MFLTTPRGAGDALVWSLEAMDAAMNRVNSVPASDLAAGFAAMGESLWWITVIADALHRDFPAEYDQALGLMSPNPADTLDGLRSVRNRVAHDVDLASFLVPVASRPDPGNGRITAWAWQAVASPEVGGGGRANARQQGRADRLHEAYERVLVGQNVWQSYTVAQGFFGQIARVINGEIGDQGPR
jgi:hypothetical protein